MGWLDDVVSTATQPFVWIGEKAGALVDVVGGSLNDLVFYNTATSYSNARESGRDTPNLGDILGAITDPLVPDYVYAPAVGTTWGGALPGEQGPVSWREPDDRGWFPEGIVPDAFEKPLAVVLLAAAGVAAVLLAKE